MAARYLHHRGNDSRIKVSLSRENKRERTCLEEISRYLFYFWEEQRERLYRGAIESPVLVGKEIAAVFMSLQCCCFLLCYKRSAAYSLVEENLGGVWLLRTKIRGPW